MSTQVVALSPLISRYPQLALPHEKYDPALCRGEVSVGGRFHRDRGNGCTCVHVLAQNWNKKIKTLSKKLLRLGVLINVWYSCRKLDTPLSPFALITPFSAAIARCRVIAAAWVKVIVGSVFMFFGLAVLTVFFRARGVFEIRQRYDVSIVVVVAVS